MNDTRGAKPSPSLQPSSPRATSQPLTSITRTQLEQLKTAVYKAEFIVEIIERKLA